MRRVDFDLNKIKGIPGILKKKNSFYCRVDLVIKLRHPVLQKNLDTIAA